MKYNIKDLIMALCVMSMVLLTIAGLIKITRDRERQEYEKEQAEIYNSAVRSQLNAGY